MNLQLNGARCLVTGGSRGLGRAIVTALAGEGAHVVAAARDRSALEGLVAPSASGTILPCEVDLSDLGQAALLPRRAADMLGGLDIVVNNAGVAPAQAFVDHDADAWQRVVALNLLAPVEILRGAHSLLAESGGRVVNVASVGGLRGKAGTISYGTTKAALIQLTRSLAIEWAPDGINVNAVAPGAFGTSMQQAVLDDPDLLARRVRRVPAKRMADPEEIGPLVAYLASPLSKFVTGAVYTIDGGEEAKL